MSPKITYQTDLDDVDWGESIFVTIDDGHIRAISECRFPLQMINWGKNSSKRLNAVV